MDQEHNRAPTLATCTEEERQEAMGRLAVLRSHINDGVPLPEAARDAGVPFRSVQRWLARYRATGLAGLGFQALWPDNVTGLDHGAGHSLLLLCDAKASRGKNSMKFKGLGDDLFNVFI